MDPESAWTEPSDMSHPWPYLKDMFEFKAPKNDSWRFQCGSCLPKKEIVASIQEFAFKFKVAYRGKQSDCYAKLKSLTFEYWYTGMYLIRLLTWYYNVI